MVRKNVLDLEARARRVIPILADLGLRYQMQRYITAYTIGLEQSSADPNPDLGFDLVYGQFSLFQDPSSIVHVEVDLAASSPRTMYIRAALLGERALRMFQQHKRMALNDLAPAIIEDIFLDMRDGVPVVYNAQVLHHQLLSSYDYLPDRKEI